MAVLPAHVLLRRLHARARIRHLQVLVKLAELGSLKRGGEALGMSQPAVTQLLADLERLLETQLFERHSRGVRITDHGEALLPTARRMLAALAEGSETLTAMKQAGEGVVRVAGITSAITGMLGLVLPGFVQAHPHIQVQVRECDLEQASLLLAQGDVDLLALREPPAPAAGTRFIPVLDDRLVVVSGPQHPLAGKRGLAWSTLVRETWLVSPVDSTARERFDAILAEQGQSPLLSPVVTRVQSLTWSLLASQRVLTLVPYGVVRQLVEAGQLSLVGTREPMQIPPLGLVVPDGRPHAATSRFIEFTQRFLPTA